MASSDWTLGGGNNGSEGSDGAEWLDLDTLARGTERLGAMVGHSPQIREVFRAIARLGPYKATVLIMGESGTGKELVARALHTFGPAPRGPFVTFNCSNLVEALAESQLFGHVKGAFTDAREDSQGYFRSANGGTLFLDEIGELPLRLQAKLLRAVETYEVQPVGSTNSYHVDIRLVAASNRDLRAYVKDGQFRDDLFYRLNATSIVIPPLDKRRGDIPVLCAHFIEHYDRLLGKQVKYLSRRALATLLAYDWPGNIREFANAIESGVLLTDNDRIDIGNLPVHVTNNDGVDAVQPADVLIQVDGVAGIDPPAADGASAETPAGSGFSLDEVMKKTLLRSLEETEGNRRRAAELLGVSRSTLYRMLSRYGLEDTGRRRFGGPKAPIIPDDPAQRTTKNPFETL